jgi:hypothetical protein
VTLDGQLHAPDTLLPRKEHPISAEQDTRWVSSESGRFRRLKFLATTGTRNPHRPVRSLLSLY